MSQVIEDVIGQPIKGKPDCYLPGPGDKGIKLGSTVYPQGADGPCFVKESYVDPFLGTNVGMWRHIAGAPVKTGNGFY